LDAAAKRFSECQSIFHDTGFLREETQALNNLGLIHHQRHEYEPALKYFQQALQQQEAIGDWDDIKNVYMNIADCLYSTGNYPASLHAYDTMHGLADEQGDTRILSMVYAGRSENHIAAGNIHEALQCAERSIQLARLIEQSVELGFAFRVSGDVHLTMGEFAKAERFYRLSIPILERAHQPDELQKACCGCEYAVGNLVTTREV
jgi:tetratricopeptide (TPR) repeat protein